MNEDGFLTMEKNRKMKKSKYIYYALTMPFLLLALMSVMRITVLADGEVTFGSGGYTPEDESTFNVGVYVGSTDERLVGDYTVNLTYDPNVLEYVSGAAEGGGGTVTIQNRSADGGRSLSMLAFRVVGQGTTSINVVGASVSDDVGEPMENAAFPSVPVSVQAKRTPPPASMTVNGKEVPGFAADKTEYTFAVPYAEEFVVEVPDGYTVTTNPVTPVEGRNEISAIVQADGLNAITYTLHVNMQENKNKQPEETAAPETQPEPEKEEKQPEETVTTPETEDAANTANTGTEGGDTLTSDPQTGTGENVQAPGETVTEPEKGKSPKMSKEIRYILIIAGFIVLIVLVFVLKNLIDYIASRRGVMNDLDRLKNAVDMRRKETEQDNANPFDYASIDTEVKTEVVQPKNKNVTKNAEGIVDLFGTHKNDKPEEEVESGVYNLNLRETDADKTAEAAKDKDAADKDAAGDKDNKEESVKAEEKKESADAGENHPPKIHFGVHRTSVGEMGSTESVLEQSAIMAEPEPEPEPESEPVPEPVQVPVKEENLVKIAVGEQKAGEVLPLNNEDSVKADNSKKTDNSQKTDAPKKPQNAKKGQNVKKKQPAKNERYEEIVFDDDDEDGFLDISTISDRKQKNKSENKTD